jgi:hypothetical protein
VIEPFESIIWLLTVKFLVVTLSNCNVPFSFKELQVRSVLTVTVVPEDINTFSVVKGVTLSAQVAVALQLPVVTDVIQSLTI